MNLFIKFVTVGSFSLDINKKIMTIPIIVNVRFTVSPKNPLSRRKYIMMDEIQRSK